MASALLHAEDFLDPATGIHHHRHTVWTVASAPHRHDFPELFLIESGGVVHRVNGATVPLSAGDLVFMRPEDEHAYESLPGHICELRNLAFGAQLPVQAAAFAAGRMDLSAWREPPLPPVRHLVAAEFKQARRDIDACLRLPPHEATWQWRILLFAWFCRAFPVDAIADSREPLPDWLAEALARLSEARPGREFAWLRRVAGRSPEHLCRTFRRCLGTTPKAYLNRRRLAQAAVRLRESPIPIDQVARDAGFANLGHFHQLFRREFGETPGRYRCRHRHPPSPIPVIGPQRSLPECSEEPVTNESPMGRR
jgi:AraC family cel operon transcriptional repressor